MYTTYTKYTWPNQHTFAYTSDYILEPLTIGTIKVRLNSHKHLKVSTVFEIVYHTHTSASTI